MRRSKRDIYKINRGEIIDKLFSSAVLPKNSTEFNERFSDLLFQEIKNHGGQISIEDFNEFEGFLRPVMRKNERRAIYRGPRISNNCKSDQPSMTRRCDATSVFITYGA